MHCRFGTFCIEQYVVYRCDSTSDGGSDKDNDKGDKKEKGDAKSKPAEAPGGDAAEAAASAEKDDTAAAKA